ncbi:MAG: nucleotidyltransferase domain-containing protein [Magnetococcales bacterium]|nr:nucleotidyltransferase domain-containing protein [Magnetococcales bacterium]
MSVDLDTLPMVHIRRFCERWRIREFSLFGSMIRAGGEPPRDVDVLVSFEDAEQWGLFELVAMRDELRALFGREVDLVSRAGIEASRNAHRRQAILESAVCIYGA